MRPQADRLAVVREANERTLPWGLVLPRPDMGLAFVGVVTHAGPARMDVKVGDRICYSTRIDTYVLADDTCIDIVPEKSVIGLM